MQLPSQRVGLHSVGAFLTCEGTSEEEGDLMGHPDRMVLVLDGMVDHAGTTRTEGPVNVLFMSLSTSLAIGPSAHKIEAGAPELVGRHHRRPPAVARPMVTIVAARARAVTMMTGNEIHVQSAGRPIDARETLVIRLTVDDRMAEVVASLATRLLPLPHRALVAETNVASHPSCEADIETDRFPLRRPAAEPTGRQPTVLNLRHDTQHELSVVPIHRRKQAIGTRQKAHSTETRGTAVVC